MEIELTKDAEYLLCILYREYESRIAEGISKHKAKFFGSSVNIHDKLIGDMSADDVDETCRELSRAKFANVEYADDIAFYVVLSDKAIIYMENRFSRNVKSLLEHIVNLKQLIF